MGGLHPSNTVVFCRRTPIHSFHLSRILLYSPRIKISENKAFTAAFPETLSTRIEVVTRSGQRIIEVAEYPKGHAKNPMSDEDVNNKFAMVCEGVMSATQRDTLREALWNIDQAANLDRVFELLVPGK